MAKTNYSNMAKKQEPVVETNSLNEAAVDIQPVVEEKKAEPPAPKTKRGVVTGCIRLNIRKDADASADILGTLAAGESVIIRDTVGEFYKVETPDHIAFCMKKYISIK